MYLFCFLSTSRISVDLARNTWILGGTLSSKMIVEVLPFAKYYDTHTRLQKWFMYTSLCSGKGLCDIFISFSFCNIKLSVFCLERNICF